MRYIEFKYEGEVIRGMIQGDAKRIIVMAHGFTGSRVDHHRFGVMLSNLYEELDFSVLRFDFLGSGESSGDTSYYTPESEMNQLKFVLDNVKNDYDEVYLYGFSYGGVIASHVANEYQDIIKGLILVNPAGNMPQVISDVKSTSKELVDGWDNNGFYFTNETLDAISAFDTYKGLENFNKPVYLMQGDADVCVSMKSYETFLKTFKNVKGYVLKDCDHCFTGVAKTQLLLDTMTKIVEEI